MHHYSIRSYEQWEKKAIIGGKAYEKYPGSNGDGIHWRNNYMHWKNGTLYNEYVKITIKNDEIINRNLYFRPYYL